MDTEPRKDDAIEQANEGPKPGTTAIASAKNSPAAGETKGDSPPSGLSLPLGASATVIALLALLLASVAVLMQDDDGGSSTETGADGGTTVTLTEFAIEPAAIEVSAGGSLAITNSGSADHDMTIRDTDVATATLTAGETTDLDVSSLEPGEYEVFCSIPGHEDAGMKATLTVTEGGAVASPADSGGGDNSGEAAGGHGDHMTEEDYQRMDQAMEDSIMAYPAETEGSGNQLLEPTVLGDGTKQFELTAEITPWEVEPGNFVDAWTYNGMVPGPVIQADVGDTVQIVVNNELPMGTDLHVHGVNLANGMDGVAPITQELIEPGGSFTYEFEADRPAVAMYHAHHHGQLQVPNGLLGAVLIGDMPLPTGRTVSGLEIPRNIDIVDEIPMVLNDTGVIGYSLNGKSFPATEPIVAQQGDWFLAHYFNEGGQIHPMHLHQFEQIVIAKDGLPLDEPYAVDTLNVAPGERYTVLFQAKDPGTWVWHCHILNHVERETGMFGMVTAVVVE